MREFFGRRVVRVFGIVALVVVVIVLLFLVLNWYVAPTQPDERKDLVLAVAQILGGTALLSGLYFTWRTLQVNRQGQITERFTRAIDQLGATDDKGDKLFEVRLGGIYALERIARESNEDYWPIMEVLTAYMRQNARKRPQEHHDSMEGTAVEKESKDSGIVAARAAAIARALSPKPDPDIQAIMTVLRRRPHSFDHGELVPLDLSDTNLSKGDLKVANLKAANLMGANLFQADLSGANLTLANLFKANLSEAMLPLAVLESTYLSGADLMGAHLWSANLSGASLFQVDLSGADLSGADLSGADLSGANLSGANLPKANLTQDQLENTFGDTYTQLPAGIKPPAHWGAKTDEQTEGS